MRDEASTDRCVRTQERAPSPPTQGVVPDARATIASAIASESREHATPSPLSATSRAAAPPTRIDDRRPLREGGEDLRRIGIVISTRPQRGERGSGSRHPPIRLIRADGGDQLDADHASRPLRQFIPSAPLAHKHESGIPETTTRTLESLDEDLGGQPLGDRARVDEDGAVAGGESVPGCR